MPVSMLIGLIILCPKNIWNHSSHNQTANPKYDKFILVATNGAIDSKWCNWELGYGDAQKFDLGKIALFPIAQNDNNWKGSEYMQIYPTIQYYSGTERYSNGNLIPRGYYYCYNDKDGNYCIKNLYDWIVS